MHHCPQKKTRKDSIHNIGFSDLSNRMDIFHLVDLEVNLFFSQYPVTSVRAINKYILLVGWLLLQLTDITCWSIPPFGDWLQRTVRWLTAEDCLVTDCRGLWLQRTIQWLTAEDYLVTDCRLLVSDCRDNCLVTDCGQLFSDWLQRTVAFPP